MDRGKLRLAPYQVGSAAKVRSTQIRQIAVLIL